MTALIGAYPNCCGLTWQPARRCRREPDDQHLLRRPALRQVPRKPVRRRAVTADAELCRLLPADQILARFPPPPRFAGYSEHSAITVATLAFCRTMSHGLNYLPTFVSLRKRIAAASNEDRLSVYPPTREFLDDHREIRDVLLEIQAERDLRNDVRCSRSDLIDRCRRCDATSIGDRSSWKNSTLQLSASVTYASNGTLPASSCPYLDCADQHSVAEKLRAEGYWPFDIDAALARFFARRDPPCLDECAAHTRLVLMDQGM